MCYVREYTFLNELKEKFAIPTYSLYRTMCFSYKEWIDKEMKVINNRKKNPDRYPLYGTPYYNWATILSRRCRHELNLTRCPHKSMGYENCQCDCNTMM